MYIASFIFSNLDACEIAKYFLDKGSNKGNWNTFFAYKMKINYFLTNQVVWAFRKFFFLQFDTKFVSKPQRLAKIGTILWYAFKVDPYAYFDLMI